MGAIMYILADIDFSNRLGVLVSEPQPDDMDLQDQMLNAGAGGHPARPCDGLLAL